jgi:hypothetical protein
MKLSAPVFAILILLVALVIIFVTPFPDLPKAWLRHAFRGRVSVRSEGGDCRRAGLGCTVERSECQQPQSKRFALRAGNPARATAGDRGGARGSLSLPTTLVRLIAGLVRLVAGDTLNRQE